MNTSNVNSEGETMEPNTPVAPDRARDSTEPASLMTPRARQQHISKLVAEHGQLAVTDLSRMLSVSGMTIRRDLAVLSEGGKIQRVHGGAMVRDAGMRITEPPLVDRMDNHVEEKDRIAKEAASLVRPGETIFVGSGTTTLLVANYLDQRDLTVVTNSLPVMATLARGDDVRVISLGGFLRREEMSFVGHFTEAAVSDIRADKVIMGMRGIDAEQGLTSDYLDELKTDRAIMQATDTLILVADNTKFGRVAAARTAPITAASYIITDTQAPAQHVDRIRTMGVDVIEV